MCLLPDSSCRLRHFGLRPGFRKLRTEQFVSSSQWLLGLTWPVTLRRVAVAQLPRDMKRLLVFLVVQTQIRCNILEAAASEWLPVPQSVGSDLRLRHLTAADQR